MLLVDAAHQGSRGWQDLIDEDENGLLRGELDTLPDDVDELTDGQVRGHQILLLIDGGDVGLFHLLADDLLRARSALLFFIIGEAVAAGHQ